MTDKPLEDVLRDAARSGRLNHVSLAYTDKGWEAAYRGASHGDHRMTTHADPACALRAALTGKPGEAPAVEKPKRARKVAAPVDDVFGDLM